MPKPAPVLYRAARLLALAAVLSACDADDITGGGGGGGENNNPPTSSSLARFNVDLSAAGSFRPGHPVQLTMSVRALLPTNDAKVDLILPELAEAELRGGWGRYEPVRGRSLPPLASHRKALGRGAVTQHQASVTFPRPGIYSVWASANSSDSLLVDGQPVQNSEVRVLYLWISETGGRVMEQYDPSLLPDEALPGLGPIRRRSERGTQPGGTQKVVLQSGSIRVLVDYWSDSAQAYVPVSNAQYRVQVYNSAGTLLQNPTGQTDASGYITIPCGTGHDRFVVNVWAANAYVTVGTTSDFRTGKLISQGTYYASSSCGYTEYPMATPDVSQVFNNMTITATSAHSFFGLARTRLPVLLVADATYTYSAYCPYAHAACPGSGVDYVKINTHTGGTYGQQVWGQNGVWTQAHEFGHAYHEKALSGYVDVFWKAANCAQVHPISQPSKLQCAYPEGFADYFAVTTRGDATGYEYGIEINWYWLQHAGHTADGSVVEGAVASFFYDITDGNRWNVGTPGGQLDEAHDAVRYPGRLVADMVSTCQVAEGGVWKRASGIDHIVHCLEKAVHPAITSSSFYFPTRGTDPTAQQVATSQVWDAAAVRKLWLKNLYGRTTL